jgi:hypothetical protein
MADLSRDRRFGRVSAFGVISQFSVYVLAVIVSENTLGHLTR